MKLLLQNLFNYVICSLPGVAGDGSRDLYEIVGPSYTIFRTNYGSPNWSRDLWKLNFRLKNGLLIGKTTI